MDLKQQRAYELLRLMSGHLAIDEEPQDWGILNADGERVDLFIEYLEDVELEDTQRFELAGLILASMNERILDGGGVDVVMLRTLIRDYKSSFDVHLSYWCGLSDAVEFPLGGALRDAGFC